MHAVAWQGCAVSVTLVIPDAHQAGADAVRLKPVPAVQAPDVVRVVVAVMTGPDDYIVVDVAEAQSPATPIAGRPAADLIAADVDRVCGIGCLNRFGRARPAQGVSAAVTVSSQCGGGEEAQSRHCQHRNDCYSTHGFLDHLQPPDAVVEEPT